jgi:hypothetical protein
MERPSISVGPRGVTAVVLIAAAVILTLVGPFSATDALVVLLSVGSGYGFVLYRKHRESDSPANADGETETGGG